MNDQEKLYNYIMKIFNLKEIDNTNKELVNNYVRRGFSYHGILNALIYWYEVLKRTTDKADGRIGIVPHVYDEAQLYYGELNVKRKRFRKTFGDVVGRKVNYSVDNDYKKQQILYDLSKIDIGEE